MTPSSAAQVIRALLDGGAPDPAAPAQCASWAEVVSALHEAHAAGGTDAVRRAYQALAGYDRNLAVLLAGAPPVRTTGGTLAELRALNFPEPRWAVPGLIPVGLSFLAGRPKLGKSWLALQIAHGAGTGGIVLGQPVAQGKVLYLALEDSPCRLVRRANRQQVPSAADIYFETRWPHLGEGGLAAMQAKIHDEGYTLVIVDTLSRALGRADQLDAGEMTVLLGELQSVAQAHEAAVLLIDHHRKPAGYESNPIDDIMGSTAKAAVADAALGLVKSQGKRGATLQVTGRDLEDRELALDWDATTCCWQLLGDAQEVALQGRRGDVLRVLQEWHPDPVCTADIAEQTGLDRGNISHILGDLVKMSLVKPGPRQGKKVPYSLTKQGVKAGGVAGQVPQSAQPTIVPDS